MVHLLTEKLLHYIKTGQVIRFYKSKEWIEVRDYIRQIQNNECQECKRQGKVGRCDVVHHKKHLREYPLLALEPSNLECLCHMHHEEQHPEKFDRARKVTNRELKRPPDFKERW